MNPHEALASKDFESFVSTNSTTPAKDRKYSHGNGFRNGLSRNFRVPKALNSMQPLDEAIFHVVLEKSAVSGLKGLN